MYKRQVLNTVFNNWLLVYLISILNFHFTNKDVDIYRFYMYSFQRISTSSDLIARVPSVFAICILAQFFLLWKTNFIPTWYIITNLSSLRRLYLFTFIFQAVFPTLLSFSCWQFWRSCSYQIGLWSSLLLWITTSSELSLIHI